MNKSYSYDRNKLPVYPDVELRMEHGLVYAGTRLRLLHEGKYYLVPVIHWGDRLHARGEKELVIKQFMNSVYNTQMLYIVDPGLMAENYVGPPRALVELDPNQLDEKTRIKHRNFIYDEPDGGTH